MDESQRFSLGRSVFNGLAAVLTVLFFAALWILGTTPNPTAITGCLTTNFNKVRLCPDDGSYLRLHQVSEITLESILASEDASFFQHNGFDWFELEQSFWLNLSRGTFVRGGSTITQQLAKNVFLTPEKSILRKIREALLAAQIERLLSKKEILERYINVIELGPDIYGLRRAAKYYFNAHPSELHLLQTAYLVYLLPNPRERHRTFKDMRLTDYARKRIIEISQRLFRFKKISASQHLAATELVDRFPWTDFSTAELTRVMIPTAEELDVTFTEEIPGDGEPYELDGDPSETAEVPKAETESETEASVDVEAVPEQPFDE